MLSIALNAHSFILFIISSSLNHHGVAVTSFFNLRDGLIIAYIFITIVHALLISVYNIDQYL